MELTALNLFAGRNLFISLKQYLPYSPVGFHGLGLVEDIAQVKRGLGEAKQFDTKNGRVPIP